MLNVDGALDITVVSVFAEESIVSWKHHDSGNKVTIKLLCLNI